MKENEQYTSEGRHNDAEFKVLDGQKGLTDGQREIIARINRGMRLAKEKKEQDSKWFILFTLFKPANIPNLCF